MLQRAPGIYEIALHDKEKEVSEILIYLIPGTEGRRSLLVDAGFGNRESARQMDEILEELGISYGDLDIFLTHKHHDHCGLASTFAGKGARLFMNPEEDMHSYNCLYHHSGEKAKKEQKQVLSYVGVTPEGTPDLWKRFMEINERVEKKQEPWIYKIQDYPYVPVREGQMFSYGGYHFRSVLLRGHTYGQMGLFDSEKKVLFSADHVIEGIVPIVATTHTDEHLLGLYFDSLSRFKTAYNDCLVLPGHVGPLTDIPKLVDKIAYSYIRKMDQIKQCVDGSEKAQTVWEIARQVYKIGEIPREDDDFVIMKSMISKTFTCLEYLYDYELIDRREEDHILNWSRIKQKVV